MANILLIGGSGFLSGHVAQAALAQGHRVWAVTRGQRPLLRGVEGLVADRANAHELAQAVAAPGVDYDLVIDGICYHPEEARAAIEIFCSRARQLVLVSTDFVYDPARRRLPQTEDDAEYVTGDSYGARKRQAELELITAGCGELQWTIFRPGHIYGPGSQLGCLPAHGRDPELLDRLRRGEPLRLVGGGHFLQQPVYAPDLAQLMLGALGNEAAYGRIFNASGPEMVESRRYYELIAETMGLDLRIDEVPVQDWLAEHPEAAPFLCHRIYDLRWLRIAGLKAPSTPLAEGLAEHVRSLVTT